MGTNTGVKLIIDNGSLRNITSMKTCVNSVCVSGNIICTLGPKPSGLWSVTVYNNINYQRIHSWERELHVGAKMALRGDSVVICEGKRVTEHSLDGRSKRRALFQAIQCVPKSISAMSQSDDVIVIDKQLRVHRLSITTGCCVWTNDSLPKPIAVCCDETNRVFIAVRGEDNRVNFTVLDSERGKFILCPLF